MSLRLSGVWFSYPSLKRYLLQDVDLEIADGESVALMGPSGSGKSTMLNIAGLLQAPERGVVHLDGVEVHTRDAGRLLGRSIAWVLQSVNLLPRRTVLDNVLLPARAHGHSGSALMPRAIELLEELGLGDYPTREARMLSGGEAQRVGVARALVVAPSLLIADEPTANLDRAAANEVAERLLLAAKGTSVLLATHDPMVGAMADRIVNLADWRA